MKQKILPFSLIIILFLILVIPRKQKVAAYDGFSEESILPVNYYNPGDRSKWGYDSRYATSVESTHIYENGKIYILLYDCSYEGGFNYNPRDFYLDHYIRKADGSVYWFPELDRDQMLNDESDMCYDYPYPLHRTFYLDPYEISGAVPYRPTVVFENKGDYGINASFTGKANIDDATYSYDFEVYKKGSGERYYLADEGTSSAAPDYLTGFYYTIDTNPGDTSWNSSWNRLSTTDSSGQTKKLKTEIPQNNVSTDTNYYLHAVSVSYTGKISKVSTFAIPHRGIHTLKYDLSGGEGNFPDQKKYYGADLRIPESVPRMPGYTFTAWKGKGDEDYKAASLYKRDQNGGEYTLTANWQENNYNFHFDGNSQDGLNGEINGEMPDVKLKYTDTGLPENKFVNTSVQNSGSETFSFEHMPCGESAENTPAFTFMGWSTSPDKKENFISCSGDSPDEWKNLSVKELVHKLNLEYAPDSTIILYAIWDKAPEVISAENLYITKSEVETGISPSGLLQKVEVQDREDGRLKASDTIIADKIICPAFASSGQKSKGTAGPAYVNGQSAPGNINSAQDADTVCLWDFDLKDLNISGDKGAVLAHGRAVDKIGNKSDFYYWIYIYDSSPLKGEDGSSMDYIRFVDKENYDKKGHGGLWKDSVWYSDPEYKKAISDAFSSQSKDGFSNQENTYTFSQAEISEISNRVKKSGPGDYDAFITKYLNIKKGPHRL